MIHKVTPSAYSLSDKETDHCNVKNRHNLHFLYFGNGQAAEQRTDNSAVNGKSAVVDVENFNRVLSVVVPFEETEIESCTDNSRYYSCENAVDKL